MGDFGYSVKCYDCGKKILCGEEEFNFPPIERVCFDCARKRQRYVKDVSEPYTDDLEPCLPYYD